MCNEVNLHETGRGVVPPLGSANGYLPTNGRQTRGWPLLSASAYRSKDPVDCGCTHLESFRLNITIEVQVAVPAECFDEEG